MSEEKSKAEVVKYGRLSFMQIEGMLLPIRGFPPEYIPQIANMVVKEEDIFVVTYPKSGTTWSQYMIWEILNNSDDVIHVSEMMVERFPFLEMVGLDALQDMAPPRTMKLHLPVRLTPFQPQGKYVVMFRNAYDVCVSYYYYLKEMDFVVDTPEDFSFEEFFELFMKGTLPFGDYFQFINSWFEEKHNSNVLLIYYEDCKRNQEESVKRIAAFLGEKYIQRLEEDPEAMLKILKRTSFDYMKGNLDFILPVAHDDNIQESSLKKINIFRKGKIGDWRNYFTADQQKRLLQRLQNDIHDQDLRKKITPAELYDD